MEILDKIKDKLDDLVLGISATLHALPAENEKDYLFLVSVRENLLRLYQEIERKELNIKRRAER